MTDGPRKVLIFSPSEIGGISEHAHYQALELSRRGVAVTVLTRPNPMKAPPPGTYRQLRILPADTAGRGLARIGRVLATSWGYWVLAWWVLRLRPDIILLEANSEYFAPLWAWPHLALSRLIGFVYVANFHDPLRTRHFGPQWLHDWSVGLANAVLHGGLIHGSPPPGAQLPERLLLSEAPLGGFDDTTNADIVFDLRTRLGIGREAFVLLAFGHIADRKNLDLLIEALARTLGVDLVVAGEVSSGSQRPVTFYRECAERCGVVDRVHFVTEFVPDADIPAWFAGCDAVALTYRGAFVSQSGVLQHAMAWDKPVLASGGDGPLRETVERHGLGVFVTPDNRDALVEGIAQLRNMRVEPAVFARYRAGATWAANIDALTELYERLRGRA